MFSRGLHFHNTIHTNPLECKYCDKKFSRICSYQLKLHENKHEGKCKVLKRKHDESQENDENQENDNSFNKIEISKKENKRMKIDKTLFSAKLVSGIKMPFLPKGFKPLPEYESEYESKCDTEYESDYEPVSSISNKFEDSQNLLLLASVIANLEKL